MAINTDKPAKPRKLQEIFDAVIDAGLYGQGIRQHSYMCNALSTAVDKSIITQEEKTKAKKSINTYMISLCDVNPEILRIALKGAGLPSDSEYIFAIYRNWAKRPRRKTSIKSS